jgi:ParB-like chromosome segregation protein Spo0J
MTQTEIAQRINRSQATVAKTIGLLELPEDVQDRIRRGELSVSHGVALLRWKGLPETV